MQEVVAEIVEVLKRHGIEVEKDSAMIEICPGGEVVFRCKDLNRDAFERRMLMEMMDRMRTF